jgi:hypothetical protein
MLESYDVDHHHHSIPDYQVQILLKFNSFPSESCQQMDRPLYICSFLSLCAAKMKNSASEIHFTAI